MPRATSPHALLFAFIVSVVAASVAVAADRVQVRIEGIDGELRDNVKKFLTLEQQKSFEALSDERIRKLHGRAVNEIREALQPFGYYRPSIESDLVFEDGQWKARYRIERGPAIRLSGVDVQLRGAGERDRRFRRLVAEFPLVPGMKLQHALYEQGKDSLMQLATERGYFDAEYETSEIRIDLEDYTAEVVIHFATGERYRFGELRFNAPEFSSDFLRRYATFKSGESYSFNQLLDLQNTLTDSDYFSSVEVKTGTDPDNPQVVPVEVDAVARERSKYTMGFGFGTDTGLRATFGLERRRLNRFGHRWRTDLKVSEIGDSLTTRYIVPLQHPSTDQFSLAAGREDQWLEDFASTKYLVSASISRLDNDWQKTMFLNYEYDEEFRIGGERGSSRLVMPGINWTRIHANDRIYTTHGTRILLEVRGGSELLGSTASFLQGRVNLKFVRKLLDWGRVLVRGDGGYTKVLNFEELPPSVRFLTGGDFSVRGYQYNSLGPTAGGTHLLVGSAEYEHLLSETWSAAVFYDVGNAMDDFAEPLAAAAGIGARYRSPIGLIRVDIAKRLDDKGDARLVHISIGPDL
jgi:translocation and assembly module TamA